MPFHVFYTFWHSSTSSKPVPFLLSPTLPPTAASPLSPRASKASAKSPTPQSDTPLDLIHALPPKEEDEPEASSATINHGIKPVLQPSTSNSSYTSPSLVLVLLNGITNFKFY
ncbi:hypothetical protein REPUB_Repub17cG0091400 [Reevesia pubescens]